MAIGREAFEMKLYENNGLRPEEIKLILLAYRLSKYGHQGQKRTSGERYFEHPKRVSLILMDELDIADPEMLITALLHDIKEDSFILTEEDIELIFGQRVQQMVMALTKDRTLKKSRREKKYAQQLMAAEKAVKVIKLTDRLDNLRDMQGWPPKKQKEYIEETITLYLPLALEVEPNLYMKLWGICNQHREMACAILPSPPD